MPDDSEREARALRTARALLDLGHPIDEVIANTLIPADLRDFVRERLEVDANYPLVPARTIVADRNRADWLRSVDRSDWYYWPTLRQYLVSIKGWDGAAVRSLDDSSDRILRQLAPPDASSFDIRGLVLGFVQSGKTANYTALAAKAADAGYRLIVVLSGIDNGLRRQTNARLVRELVGVAGSPSAVHLPPIGRRWHEFTRPDLNGDFQPGFANHAALQGSQPVLLVVKKNGPVLRRLLTWLEGAPRDVLAGLPVLLIDDEADQASVDTRGTYQVDDDPPDPEYEPPTVINRRIRDLLTRFQRTAYVAYTATPFANILIPHDTVDPSVGNDLYPRDFIVDLPKPLGYFGAEEFFGRIDPETGAEVGGLDVIRDVAPEDILSLAEGRLPASLETALADFVLAGAARAARTAGDFPATMLVHTTQLVLVQGQLRTLVNAKFGEMRDAWRYHRSAGIREQLLNRWESEFRPMTRARGFDRDAAFGEIESKVGPFFEAVQVREINSSTGEVLDYEREPNLKAIAVGGNKLSRGLTLEGLLTSYFIRPSANYDTLMQMGRWFGFRAGYEDLTRIYTVPELAGWFADLAFVEHQLRQDLSVYEAQGITPRELGLRIWQHPTMQVTSPLKRRFASSTVLSQSYSGALQQTFKFPLRRLEDLAFEAETNLQAVRSVVRRLGDGRRTDKGPIWTDVSAAIVLEFLQTYHVDPRVGGMSIPLVSRYIERLVEIGELRNWTIAVRGRESRDSVLAEADWGLPTGPVWQISRSRIGDTESVGVITSPGDEACGLSDEQRQRALELSNAAAAEGRVISENSAARKVRPATHGLVLLYPISRHSGHDLGDTGGRRQLFDDPLGPLSRDLVGLAVSFPESLQPQRVEAYLEGTVGWRPVD
jgi:hypothetical protein